MALIKCSECSADISEKASVCPKCGCPLDVTKQVISDAKKKKRKKIIIFLTVVLTIIMILLVGIFFFKDNNNPGSIAVRLIKKDFGNNISVDSIYYNSEINGCIVMFSANGEDNTATVHLNDKTVGYQSVMDEYTKKSDSASTDEEKRQYAQQAVDYMDLYDIFWAYNLFVNGSEESGWEKIK